MENEDDFDAAKKRMRRSTRETIVSPNLQSFFIDGMKFSIVSKELLKVSLYEVSHIDTGETVNKVHVTLTMTASTAEKFSRNLQKLVEDYDSFHFKDDEE